MANVPLIKNRAIGLRNVGLEKPVHDPNKEHTVLSDKERRIFVAVFSFLAIIAVIGGIFLWQKNLSTGFSLNREQLANFVTEMQANKPADFESTNATAVANPTKDTDNDGLTDLEEINVYKTNPYNADSDSDGIPDGAEVQKGTDPNCPEGKICQGLIVTSSSSNPAVDAFSDSNDLWSSLLASSSQPNNDLLSASSASALQLGTLPVSELRQLLKNAGAKDEDLNKLTNVQLQQAWQEFLASQK